MKKKTEPPPEFAPHDTLTAEERIELPPEPPMDMPPPEIQPPQPKGEEPFLRRS